MGIWHNNLSHLGGDMVRELCDIGMVERIITNGAINIADELT
nr:MAG TPA: hypothetical protein [Caudoviricetes sp.]